MNELLPRTNASDGPPVIQVHFDKDVLRELIREALHQAVVAIDWPAGRVALDETEAAAACGVARHVLRDLRLSGQINACRLGRKIVYTRADVLAALSSLTAPSSR